LRDAYLPPPRNEADLAAAAWAAEMTALEAADGAAVMWADFDRVANDLEGSLRTITNFLALTASDGQLGDVAKGPLTRRYSKSTDVEYSTDQRRKVLAETEAKHRSEIDSAIEMLGKAAGTSPLLRKALDRAG